MLLFLKLSLLANAIFYGYSSSLDKGYVCYSEHYFCLESFLVFGPAQFLAVAVLLNIAKWTYFTLYVAAIADIDLENNSEELQTKSKIINIVTAVFSTIILVTSSVYIFKGCDGAYATDTDNDLWRKQIQQPGRRIISAEFFFLTAMFAIVSISFLLMVKKYHKEFYTQFSTLLWSAALVLTIPLLIRCLMDALTNWNSYEDYTN